MEGYILKTSAIQITGLSKRFKSRDIFYNYDLSIEPSTFNVITGPSGSGKSTLLSFIGLHAQPDSGVIKLGEIGEVQAFSRKGRQARRNLIGFLHQNYALIDHDTVFQNLAMVIKGSTTKKRILVAESLTKVGLEGFENKRIFECSGGEQQRIAIARLLCKPCEIIIADEPTGNLDENNKQKILSLLHGLHKQGKTIIVATHDESLIQIGQRIISLSDRGNTSQSSVTID